SAMCRHGPRATTVPSRSGRIGTAGTIARNSRIARGAAASVRSTRRSKAIRPPPWSWLCRVAMVRSSSWIASPLAAMVTPPRAESDETATPRGTAFRLTRSMCTPAGSIASAASRESVVRAMRRGGWAPSARSTRPSSITTCRMRSVGSGVSLSASDGPGATKPHPSAVVSRRARTPRSRTEPASIRPESRTGRAYDAVSSRASTRAPPGNPRSTPCAQTPVTSEPPTRPIDTRAPVAWTRRAVSQLRSRASPTDVCTARTRNTSANAASSRTPVSTRTARRMGRSHAILKRVSHRQVHLPGGVVTPAIEREAEVHSHRPDDGAIPGAEPDAVLHVVDGDAPAQSVHLTGIDESGDVDRLGDRMPQFGGELDQRPTADRLVAVDEVLPAGVALREGEQRARQGPDAAARGAAHRADAAGIEALEDADRRAAVERRFRDEAEPGGGAESLDERDVEPSFADQAQEMNVAAETDGLDAEAPDLAPGGVHQVVRPVPVDAQAEAGNHRSGRSALVLVGTAEGEPDGGLHVAQQIEGGAVEGVGRQPRRDVPFEPGQQLGFQEVGRGLGLLVLEEDGPEAAGLGREVGLEEVGGDGPVELRDARRHAELAPAAEEVVVPPAGDPADAFLGVVADAQLHLVTLGLGELDVDVHDVAARVVLDQPHAAEEVERVEVLARLVEQARPERLALLERD